MNEKGERPIRWGIAAAVGALVLILVLSVVALRRPEGAAVPAAAAERRDLLLPILSDGTLEPPSGGELRAAGGATVAAIPVGEGQRVRKGDILLRLDNPSLVSKALEARAAVSRLEAERTAAFGDLETGKAETARLENVVEADRRLLSEGAITRSAAESDDLALQSARERVRAARARLGSFDSEPSGGSRLELARQTARELERRVAGLTVRAPADGVVYGLPRRAGEAVEAGQVVASVADPNHLLVRARVDQPDLPKVRPGQRLLVTFDGLPERRWEGKVTLVSPGLREARGRQVGDVLGQIVDSTSLLPPNASVNVEIVVAEKKSVLVVPRAALNRDGQRRFVYKLKDGRARRQDVSVGLIGLNDVEIMAGLSQGERVLLPGAVPLSDGMRVAAREK